MKIIGLIPARFNSKRLPNKNFKILKGKLMVEYTIETAKKSDIFDKIIISGNNILVRALADIHHIEYSKRPKFLCQDDTPMVEVVLWEMRKYSDDTLVIVLQPTSPLRIAKDIRAALRKYSQSIYNIYGSLISYTTYDFIQYPKENGAIYIAELDDIRKYGHWRNAPDIIKYFMPISRSVDVDTIEDFKLAEKLLKKREK